MTHKPSNLKVQNVLARRDGRMVYDITTLGITQSRLSAQYGGSTIVSRFLEETIALQRKNESTQRRHFPRGRSLFAASFNRAVHPDSGRTYENVIFGLLAVEGGESFEDGAFGRVLIRSWIDKGISRRFGFSRSETLAVHRKLADRTIAPVNAGGHANGLTPVNDLSAIERVALISDSHRTTTSYIYGARRVSEAVGAAVSELGLDPVLLVGITRTIGAHYQDRRLEQHYRVQTAELPLQA